MAVCPKAATITCADDPAVAETVPAVMIVAPAPASLAIRTFFPAGSCIGAPLIALAPLFTAFPVIIVPRIPRIPALFLSIIAVSPTPVVIVGDGGLSNYQHNRDDYCADS